MLPAHAAINAMITANGLGNPALTNLPRKINIGISTSRDDYAHCHINDVGLKVCMLFAGKALFCRVVGKLPHQHINDVGLKV